MASKTTKKPVAKTTKKPVAKAVKKPTKVTAKPAVKKVATKPVTKAVEVKKEAVKPTIKEETKKVEVKVEEKVANTGKGEVIATRGRSKDSSILEGALIGLGILLLGLCAGGYFLIKNSASDQTLKVAVPIFGVLGLLFIAVSIVFIVEGHRNNRNKKDCLVYYGASKTFELNGYRGKTVNVKASQVVKASSVCKMLVVTYKKANGKNKRINLGWSKDRKQAKERIAALHK